MAMQYINYIKAKAHLATSKPSETPVLSEEDEQFLDRLTSQENPPPLPPRPELVATLRDAQVALMDGAQNIPLPQTPSEVTDEPTMIENGPEAGTTESAATNPKATWSWYRRDSREIRQQGRETTAAGLDDIVANLKKTEEGDSDEVKEAKREEEDMTIVLERLNLAAINNRVFSISDETQELLRQFNLVFKDLVNGVPTAYDDLEKLLTNGDRQLQKTFNSLPGFLQKLIERLPETMTKGLAPEIMAAAAERASRSGMNMGNAGKAAAAASKFGFKTPSLKELVGKPAAISGMLRSIVGYLRARFPAFMGANVLWSLAMFVLLFVFWYCHKRGKEVRLEKERKLTEDELQSLDAEFKAEYGDDMPTTTAEAGASIEDVKAGVKEAAARREAGMEEDAVTEKSVDPAIIPPTTVP
ncbi:hypothetical protein LTR99_003512 [Exophiala xenobiotica]|uniref:Uncharacterized protein n=1 Tax=Vermiconidia calcicola TaxID=1690605 RepID=A0AAV9PT54_9PEZI|nr:hypothetical protein LTR96_008181 [Exophiala xenobiotica]KAK5529117.1 hypothetical protein LTR25_009854 [Vermiconidia calcicola]KAK5529346.1 hypothetical protein LTR23_010733 [Chaetothyriales sp. CCFEE 6169]KAK5305967.1 hypothetical protein LTR99_003512 [Exophiala xenobiotica]KAK5335397.1 hypothetical protein LTR98_008397 [Exophiala xenobiotica]